MNEAQVWVLIQMIPLVAVLAFILMGWHLKQRRAIQLREMQHRERMVALEKGLAVPELSSEERQAMTPGHGWSSDRTALAAGLVLVCGGTGFSVALSLLAGKLDNLSELASLGLIPILIGAGLLLYFFLARRLDREPPSGS